MNTLVCASLTSPFGVSNERRSNAHRLLPATSAKTTTVRRLTSCISFRKRLKQFQPAIVVEYKNIQLSAFSIGDLS